MVKDYEDAAKEKEERKRRAEGGSEEAPVKRVTEGAVTPNPSWGTEPPVKKVDPEMIQVKEGDEAAKEKKEKEKEANGSGRKLKGRQEREREQEGQEKARSAIPMTVKRSKQLLRRKEKKRKSWSK